MKKKILIIICLVLVALAITAILFLKQKIWFVFPNESIFQVYGLDVSHHQGKIKWDEVDKKYKFVFVKATEAITFVDKRFHENSLEIKRTQRLFGAYHFFHFDYDGSAQAKNYIKTAGNTIELPPVVDFEFTGVISERECKRLLSELRKCINALEKHYKTNVIIYTTEDAYEQVVKGNFDNPIWYRSIFKTVDENMENLLFWQYHNSATIDGIDGIVDLNVFKGTLESLKALCSF